MEEGMPETVVRRLAERFRERAEMVRAWAAADSAAKAWEAAAAELESSYQHFNAEAVTLDDAAEECGISRRTLERKIASNEIPNVGERGRPRVRRGDLPTAQRAGAWIGPTDYDSRRLFRGIANSKIGGSDV
jgi:hypothetical protein